MSIDINKIKVAQGLERGEAGSFPVSFCIIATVEEFTQRGRGMLGTLPIDAEVNVLLNGEGDADSLSEITELSEYPKLRTRTWTYPKGDAPFDNFSFAQAR